jgi:hypothetical protein
MKTSLPGILPRRFALLFLLVGLQLAGCQFGGGEQPSTKTGERPTSATPCGATKDTAVSKQSTIVLVDRTTILEPEDRAQLVSDLKSYWARAGGRIAVITTGGTTSALTRTTFQGALPGASDVRKAADAKWSTTPAEQREATDCARRSLEAFEHAMALALDDIDASEHALSPLIEALSAVVAAADLRHGTQRLIFVSDGLQHTQSLTFYAPKADAVRQLSPQSLVEDLKRAEALPDVTGVAVAQLAIGLPAQSRQGAPRTLRPPAETRLLESIWTALYRAGGAASVSFGHPLQPGGIEFANARP